MGQIRKANKFQYFAKILVFLSHTHTHTHVVVLLFHAFAMMMTNIKNFFPIKSFHHRYNMLLLLLLIFDFYHTKKNYMPFHYLNIIYKGQTKQNPIRHHVDFIQTPYKVCFSFLMFHGQKCSEFFFQKIHRITSCCEPSRLLPAH